MTRTIKAGDPRVRLDFATQVAVGRRRKANPNGFSAGGYRPQGHLDQQGRWWPEPREVAACCQESFGNYPSKRYRWKLYQHCCTLTHVAHLFSVDPVALRRKVHALEKKLQTEAPHRGTKPQRKLAKPAEILRMWFPYGITT